MLLLLLILLGSNWPYGVVRELPALAVETRFEVPEGFVVERVLDGEDTGSLIGLVFDERDRPVVSKESGGIYIGVGGDENPLRLFSDKVEGAQGICFVARGELLVHAKGPNGVGLYRLGKEGSLGDTPATKIEFLAEAADEMTEHGPHAIRLGPDGAYYLLYGNYSRPRVEIDPRSPSRDLREDHLLPRFTDPRGHSAHITAPGGTLMRLDLKTMTWTQIAGGFRNPYDFVIDDAGEIFVYDSDMEWDVGLPWYRPTRVLHAIPGADFGWRTGSSKTPDYSIDTLPSVADLGRGSPVGMEQYHGGDYPDAYDGAIFLGDWSCGKIRVMKLRRDGATYKGEVEDFISGTPLNVTDLAVSRGHLYFVTGGRGTSGGLFRVKYKGDEDHTKRPGELQLPEFILQFALYSYRNIDIRGAESLERMDFSRIYHSDEFKQLTKHNAFDSSFSARVRVRNLALHQMFAPFSEPQFVAELAGGDSPEVRAAAAYYLRCHEQAFAEEILLRLLSDSDPLVARRACESLQDFGRTRNGKYDNPQAIASRAIELFSHEDRFLRYAARDLLRDLDRQYWLDAVLNEEIESPRARLESLLVLIQDQSSERESEQIFGALKNLSDSGLNDDLLLDYLRVVQLALIRDQGASNRDQFISELAPQVLELFPTGNTHVNRELQVLLAHVQPEGAVEKMVAYLSPAMTQEEQIHTVYCLRAMDKGWEAESRARVIEWFDTAREFRGAVSMEGYIHNLWEAMLAKLPPEEKALAEARRERAIAERNRRAAALVAESESQPSPWRTDGAQMSFDEIALYLEADPSAFTNANPDRGRWVFGRAKCADCHIFGEAGRGGGPDLSTVVNRMTRREILESIMYPSRVISDQYTALRVETKSGETHIGMLASEDNSAITLITASGEKIELNKSQIAARARSTISIMPEGLVDTMNLHDIVDLFAFLEKGAEP